MSDFDLLGVLGTVWNWIVFFAIVGGGILGLGWLKLHNARNAVKAAQERKQQEETNNDPRGDD